MDAILLSMPGDGLPDVVAAARDGNDHVNSLGVASHWPFESWAYEGRVLRWSWSLEGGAASSFTMYVFAAAGRSWELTFRSDAASAAANEATFLAIASSFRVTQLAPAAAP